MEGNKEYKRIKKKIVQLFLNQINNYNIKLKTENNYSVFFKYLNRYNNNLFVCDFENKDYFWLSILENGSLQKDKAVVK